VVNGSAGFGQLVVVGGDDSTFAGGEILARLEREGAHVADGAGGAIVERCAVGVGGVFDNGEVVLFGNRHDRVHVGDLPGEMDGDDGAGAGGNGRFDRARVDVEGFEVDVGEDRDGVGFDDGGRGGEKGVGRNDHFVLRANSGG